MFNSNSHVFQLESDSVRQPKTMSFHCLIPTIFTKEQRIEQILSTRNITPNIPQSE